MSAIGALLVEKKIEQFEQTIPTKHPRDDVQSADVVPRSLSHRRLATLDQS